MLKINKKILEKSLKYDGNVILKYHIEYPEIEGSSAGIVNFNKENQKMALDLQKRSEQELYNEAIKTYKYNKQNGYPLMVFEVNRVFKITLNVDYIVSLYYDEYVFDGGAHGTTLRTSETWDIRENKKIELYQLFKNPYFLQNIFKQINSQIEKNPSIYFEDNCKMVIDNFNPKSFFITNKGVSVYYQQYDIAPYSSGIRVFEI